MAPYMLRGVGCSYLLHPHVKEETISLPDSRALLALENVEAREPGRGWCRRRAGANLEVRQEE